MSCSGSLSTSTTSRFFKRPISPSTVREAAYTKETIGTGIYRRGIEEELAERDSDIAAFAHHRFDCVRQAGSRERELAARWRRRRQAKEPLFKVRWLLLPHVEQRLPTPPAVSEEELPPALEVKAEDEDLPPARPPTPEGYWQRGAQEEEESGEEDSGRRTPLCDRVLFKLKNRSHRLGDERAWRITLMRKRNQREKARRLAADARMTAMALAQERIRAEEHSFEASASVADYLANVRAKEVQAYQAALRRFGRRADRRIDQADLLDALNEIGFRPRNQTERAALRELLFKVVSLEVDADYVIQNLVPQVRVQLAELRRPGLINLFQEAAEDKSDLSVAELLAVLQRSTFYPTLNEVVDAVVEVIPGASALTNMEGKMLLDRISVSLPYFRILAPLLQERAEYSRRARAHQIAEELDLDEAKRLLWQDALVELRDAFEKRRIDEHFIEISNLPLVLLDTEMLPKKGPSQSLLHSLAQEELSKVESNDQQRSKDRLSLRQCARVLTKIREKECERVAAIFQASDVRSTNGLSIKEARKCLTACGIVPQNDKEENDFEELLDEFDIDESGELELEEFLALVKFMTSRLRHRRRREQADIALKHGWQAEEFERIREGFMAANQQMDGRLREGEVSDVLTELRPDWPREDTKRILRELGIFSWHVPLAIDLYDFLRVLEFVDTRMRHWRVGSLLGLDKEAVDNFCTVWWSMKPTRDDTVAIDDLVDVIKQLPGFAKKLSKLQEVINEGASRINFQRYCMVMRRSYEPRRAGAEPSTPMGPPAHSGTQSLGLEAYGNDPEESVSPRKTVKDLKSGLEGSVFGNSGSS